MELLLINGNVITMARSGFRAQAIAVSGERIAAVGSTDEVLRLRTPASRVVDLNGKTVLPGLIDSHAHAFLTGVGSMAVQLGGLTSIEEVCDAIGAKAATFPRGKWVYGMGCEPWLLPQKRFPGLAELDGAAPHNPVYIAAATFHSGVSNSAGMQLISPDPDLPGLDKDPVSGEPTGQFLSDTAHFFAASRAFGALTAEEIAEMYKYTASLAASRGVTTLHCLDGQFVEGDSDVIVLRRLASELPVHTVLMYQTMDVDRVLELGLSRIGGCLTLDGSAFDHTALYYEPYADDAATCGDLYIPEDVVRAFVMKAHRAGLQIGMHAIGDRAIDILVNAYAEAQQAFPREDCRHRVEHFISPSESAIETAARLKLALMMQPIFTYAWNPEYVYFLGNDRANRSDPFGQLSRAGHMVAGGSDSPVTEINPLLGIQSAVNNPNLQRRTSVDQALRMFTINGAWAAFEENEKGTLEAGKLADIDVVDRDPYTDSDHIDEFSVEMTVCGGDVVFSRDQAQVN
jgi:predicted amidohydrolase YtcJ